MKYYGILTPGGRGQKPYVWWITDSEHSSWNAFFEYSNRFNEHNNLHGCTFDGIRAYQAIGYRCVELELTVKQVIEPKTYDEEEDE